MEEVSLQLEPKQKKKRTPKGKEVWELVATDCAGMVDADKMRPEAKGVETFIVGDTDPKFGRIDMRDPDEPSACGAVDREPDKVCEKELGLAEVSMPENVDRP